MNTSAFWWQSADGGLAIGNSLRFRGAQYLRRTLPAGTVNSVQTYSAWVKLGSFATSTIMARYIVSGTSELSLGYVAEGFAYNRGDTGEDTNPDLHKHRDPAAWYHVFSVCNGTNYQTWINGEVLGGYSGAANGVLLVPGRTLTIGRRDSINGSFLNGYLAEVHAIDGQLLNLSEFGEFNADGVWVPKKVEGINYGTNGFYLDFSDPADIGADRSGNGNNFTATGFELTDTTSSSYDLVVDSPTDNYQTVNPLTRNFKDIFAANRGVGQSAPTTSKLSYSSTFKLPSTGKWYMEWRYESRASDADAGLWFGVCSDDFNPNTTTTARFERAYRVDNGNKLTRTSGSVSESSFGASCTAGDHISVAVDMDNGHIWFAKNGTWQGSGDPATGANPAFTDLLSADAFKQLRLHVSIRNRSVSFWDGGVLPFVYAPPAGFSGLSTSTLPAAGVTNPSDHFTTILDTGANILTAAQAKFSNGLWWIKDRANSNQHQLVDSIRGTQAWQCPGLGDATYAAPSGNSVAWCWSAPETFTADGTGGAQGSKAVTGRRNVDAGFSMGQWTQQYSASGGDTLAHGLSQPPEFFFVKGETNQIFYVYHSALGPTKGLRLNGDNAADTSTNLWNNTAPDSNVLTVGTNYTYFNNNPSMFYAWHSVPGYSSIGHWVGNGSDDGPFVYTGFRPAFVLLKNVTSGPNAWHIYDSPRTPYNPMNRMLMPNKTDPEESLSSTPVIDFVSNGIKLRKAGGGSNNSGNTYIYAAFAEHPFGGSNVSPAPAR